MANGVTINGTHFSFTDLGSGALAPGTSFIIIDNTSSSPINGVFSNLADNSTFTNNGTTYQASYEGGTGNDLTLTVLSTSIPEANAVVLIFLGCGVLFATRRK